MYISIYAVFDVLWLGPLRPGMVWYETQHQGCWDENTSRIKVERQFDLQFEIDWPGGRAAAAWQCDWSYIYIYIYIYIQHTYTYVEQDNRTDQHRRVD